MPYHYAISFHLEVYFVLYYKWDNQRCWFWRRGL